MACALLREMFVVGCALVYDFEVSAVIVELTNRFQLFSCFFGPVLACKYLKGVFVCTFTHTHPEKGMSKRKKNCS